MRRDHKYQGVGLEGLWRADMICTWSWSQMVVYVAIAKMGGMAESVNF